MLCKVYYDLLAKRTQNKTDWVAIVRIEQLYPFPKADLEAVLAPHQQVNDIVWVQEEPENQGAWWMIQHEIRRVLLKINSYLMSAEKHPLHQQLVIRRFSMSNKIS